MKWRKFIIKKKEDTIPREETKNGMMEKTEEISQEELDILKEACLKKLTDIMSRWIHEEYIEHVCKEMLDDMPEELYQNVWEWIEDKPISEIRIGELSIKELMEYTKVDFINCTKLMMRYIRGGCVNTIFFLNAYMRM